MRMAGCLLVWLACNALLLWPVAAIVKTIDVHMSDSYVLFLEYEYGLDTGATVSLDLECSKLPNSSYVIVLSHGQWSAWNLPQEILTLRSDLPAPKDEDNRNFNSYLVTAWRTSLTEKLNASFQVQEAFGGRSRYSLAIVSALKQPLAVSGTLKLMNPGGQQLSLQEVYVPAALLGAACTYLISCLVFCAVLMRASRRGTRTSLHSLIALVIALRGLTLTLQWLAKRQVEVTGTDSGFSEVVWRLMGKVQNIAELMMFLLISLGWKILRGTLDNSEVRFAMSISAISLYLGVFEVACQTPSSCNGYQLSRYILHILCQLVVIVAMNFNLQKIVQAIAEAPVSAESAKMYWRLHAYQTFRWVFLVFIIAPTALLFLNVTIVPWDAQWLFVLMQELTTWLIYSLLAFAFRPEPPCLRIFDLTQEQEEDSDFADVDG